MRSYADNSQTLHSPVLGLMLVMVLVFAVAGCTSTRNVSSPNPTTVANQVRVGDKVEIIKKNGEVVEFEVDHVSQTGLSGQGYSVIFRDITQISVTQIDTGKTVKLVAIVAVGAATVYWLLTTIAEAASASPAY